MADFYAECKAPNGVYKFYLDGEWHESASGAAVKILNPCTNAAAHQVQGVRAARGGRGGPGFRMWAWLPHAPAARSGLGGALRASYTPHTASGSAIRVPLWRDAQPRRPQIAAVD